jgi:SAM-dependent methyltransferase
MINSLKSKLGKYKYFGINNYCPCCKSRLNKFLSYGNPIRNSALCPVCSSLERHRQIWLFLNNEIKLEKRIKLVHVAPEPLFYKYFKANSFIEYYPIDLNPVKNNYPKDTIEMDITDLKFENDSIDAILCSHVLEHVPEDAKAIKEFYRVMKPGAWAILQVPLNYNLEKTYEDFSITDPKLREKHFGQDDHVRLYGRDYGIKLKDAGFKLNQIDYRNKIGDKLTQYYGLGLKDDIFFVNK